jgi:FKBP-type peptidyl-prolyl cis-trans isomerase
MLTFTMLSKRYMLLFLNPNKITTSMLKKSYLLIGSALVLGSALHADGSASVVTEEVAAIEMPAAPAVELSESELIELVGFLTAQGGGVPSLQLDASSVAELAQGLQDGLAGDVNFQEFAQEDMAAAFAQAQARAEAVEAGAAELPAIDADALQKIGLVMVAQSGLTQLGFGAEDAPLIAQGFIAGANVTEPDPTLEAKMPAFQEFIQARVAVAQASAIAAAEAVAAESIAEGVAFFETLDADPDVQKTDSGLYYKVIESGSEPFPTMEDTVLVDYKGTLIDGTQFDSSYDRGAPATFPLNGVVPGFGEGLTKIGAGGKIILYIPSDLGYGNNPRPGGPIGPGDTLIFECELREVNPAQ